MGKIACDVLADHVGVFAAEAVTDGTAPVVSNQNTLLAAKSLKKVKVFTIPNNLVFMEVDNMRYYTTYKGVSVPCGLWSSVSA